MTTIVYIIASKTDWRQACIGGHFAGSVDDMRDVFVHLSAEHQLRGTLEKHFKGGEDLILIAFEVETLGPSLKWEQSRGGDLFPHFYGYLPTSLSAWQRPLMRDSDGVPRLDEALLAC